MDSLTPDPLRWRHVLVFVFLVLSFTELLIFLVANGCADVQQRPKAEYYFNTGQCTGVSDNPYVWKRWCCRSSDGNWICFANETAWNYPWRIEEAR